MSFQLVEMLKSSDTNNKWDDVTISLRNGFKDHGDKINQISNGLMVLNSYINKSGRQLLSIRDKPIEYIKMICKQKNLSFSETPRNGVNCLELSGDCFRIVIVAQDIRMMQGAPKSDLIKQVLIEYNKEKPTSCPELQKSLSDGDYSLLLVHIEELLQLYSVGNDRTQQLKAFLCLQSLEEDINKLSQCQIVSKSQTDANIPIPLPANIIGVIKPRSGGIPSQFVFYCPKTASKIDDNNLDSDRFNIMVQLMPHNENNLLPFIPLVNLQKDSKGNCTPSYVTADSLKCVSLAAKFVLKLSRPLVLSETNMQAIASITGLNVITTQERTNYVDLILEQSGSFLTFQERFYSILPNDSQIVFQIVNENSLFGACVAVSVPFLLPSQLPKIIAILKKQAVVNMMMESFLVTNAKEEFESDCFGAQPININIVSHDEFICSFQQSNMGDINIKFSVSFNEYGQSIVKLLCPVKSDTQLIECPQKVTHTYNNLPMTIFWLLYKSGSLSLRESVTFTPNSETESDKTDTDSLQKENDSKLLKQTIQMARASLNIRSVEVREIFPKIKIEPKLELLTTIVQSQIVNSPSIVSHYDTPNTIASKITSSLSGSVHEQNLIQTQDFQSSYQHNQYLQQHQTICQSLNSVNSQMSANSMNCGQIPTMPMNHTVQKTEPYQPYAGHGNKHMSLDQMLSSDFAMPFASDGLGPFNPMAHQMHYQEHGSNNAQNINNMYGGHMGNFKESPNSKTAHQLESQSSVLVNLLNCSENSTSSNSNLLSRQISNNLIPQCFGPNSYLTDHLDNSKNIPPQMLRGSQIPRMRMPHPNQPPKPNFNSSATNPSSSSPSLPINRSPSTCKSDIMMMPYPQDTGSGRGASIRKPRKRRAPNLELNQRLPKLQTSQFPLIQQPTPPEAMHMSGLQLNHLPPPSQQQQQLQQQQPITSMHNQNQSSSSNASFSSPTTMDQSVYDFDDNVEFSRSRTVSSNSSISPHSLNRRLSGSGSKKPLKVKISRKIISQNPSMDTSTGMECQVSNNYDVDLKSKEKALMCRSNTMPNISNIILSAPSSTSSVNTVIGVTTTTPSGVSHSRPTAIMSAIDSPLTCSSMSSMQASPYGSVNMIGSQQNFSGTQMLDNCDEAGIKKRRKRRLKPEQSEDDAKREKLESRKQSKKKKEAGSGMSSHGSMENLAGLVGDSTLKPPLPIKLSVNAKMGSVSNSSVRNSKVTSPAVSQVTGAWNTQTNGPMVKLSKESKTASGVEPILRNYKIPKKKSSDNHSYQESIHGSLTASMSNKMSSIEQNQKSSKDLPDVMKMEMSAANFAERTKSPDLSGNIVPQSNDQDIKSMLENHTNISTPKVKNIHDVTDRLWARTSSVSVANVESIINSNPTASMDLAQVKLSDYNQNTPENIFEKFSSSKSNSKSDHRQQQIQGTPRFPDSSMNIPRYPYQRPTGVHPPRPSIAPPSFNYNNTSNRQPFLSNNTNNAQYRMESAPPRNFPPATQTNLQYQKKTAPGAGFPPNRKK